MTISCWGDFKKQVEIPVKFLFRTAEKWWREDQLCVILYTFCDRRVNVFFELPSKKKKKSETLAVFG